MANKAYLLLFLTTLFWAGNAVAGKLAVGHVSPMILSTIRWALASLLLAPFAVSHLRHDWPRVRASFPVLAALGIGGLAIFNIFFYLALTHTSAINVSIEQASIPMVIFLANFVFFSTRVSWAQLLGLALSVIGVALTASHGDLTRLFALDVNRGDALMLVAVLAYAFYSVMLRFKPAIHWITLMFVMSVLATLASVPFALWELSGDSAIWPDLTGWAIIAYTAIFASLMAQVFYLRGVEFIGPNRAGVFINLVPVFGTVLSIAVLRETLYLYHVIAIVLVFGGIWLAERSGRRMAP